MTTLLIGHSLIEYGDWQRLLPGHDALNLGLSGETTAGLLGRLEGLVRDHPAADAVAVMSGTNDLLLENDSFLHEFRSVARRLRRAYPGARIVLHAVLPIAPDWVAPVAVARANARIAAIAAETGSDYLDLTKRFGEADGQPRAALYDADGVHLSRQGYAVWAEALSATLGTG